MALNATYDNQDDIPEQYRDLYTERDGKWELTGITGFKTQADIDRINEGLSKERAEHKETKEKLKVFVNANVDVEQYEKDQTELVELRAKVEAGAGEGFDQDKFDEAVAKLAEAKTVTATAPINRENERLTAENEELRTANDGHVQRETTRTISDAVRTAATTSKVIDTAMDDVLMLGERVFAIQEDGTVLTRDEVGCTPGIAPDIWLSEMQERRPHWWPTSTGGGANGSGGGNGFSNNPFSATHWNLTEQGKIVRDDAGKAERMAKAAGTSVGGPRPVAPNATPLGTQPQG
jgi:hypothetical protein